MMFYGRRMEDGGIQDPRCCFWCQRPAFLEMPTPNPPLYISRISFHFLPHIFVFGVVVRFSFSLQFHLVAARNATQSGRDPLQLCSPRTATTPFSRHPCVSFGACALQGRILISLLSCMKCA